VVPRARIDIVEPAVSRQDLEELTQGLREELLHLDVDDATGMARQDAAPAGARGLDASEVGALLVTMESSVTLLAAVVNTIQAWLARAQAPTRIVRVTIADQSIELGGATGEQQNRLVEAFLQTLTAG
jgi:hypothetical protein